MSKQAHEGLPEAPSREEVREQLRRVLLSRHFVKARKKSRFLEFMCERALSGKAGELNEYTIGVDIYERGPEFNPQEDSIVRVQAHEIRKSLQAYYDGQGRQDPVRIDLRAGGYVPLFLRVQEKRAAAPAVRALLQRWNGALRWVVIGAAASGLVAAGWLLGAAESKASGAGGPGVPAASIWFWEPFLPPAGPPLVVLPVHPLFRLAHGGDNPAVWRRGQPIAKDELPEFRDTIHFRDLPEFRLVPDTTDFTAVGESLGLLNISDFLASAGQKIRANAGRLVDYETIKSGNTILLGGNQSWSGRIFVYADGFQFRNGVITNDKPLPGEQTVYRPEFDPVTGSLSRDYALILMLPNERRDRRVLLIYGIYTQGSQAAIEYITNADRLAELRGRLAQRSPDRKSLPQYFQVLLSTSVENAVPGKVLLVSTRIIPE